MFKRIALVLTITIVFVGVIFITLDILDIAEGFRLNLSIAVLNTIFICGVAALTAYFAARVFVAKGSPEMLALSGAALTFGIGFALYGWLTDAELGTRIVAHDSGISLAAIMLTGGAGLKLAGWNMAESATRPRMILLSISYLVIIAVMGVVTWLAYQGLISFLQPAIGPIGYRSIARGGTAILLLASACYYLRNYLKTRLDVYYWYSLGLILIACGVVFISQAALQSRTAWWGRVSEYAGFIYLLLAVLTTYRRKLPDPPTS